MAGLSRRGVDRRASGLAAGGPKGGGNVAAAQSEAVATLSRSEIVPQADPGEFRHVRLLRTIESEVIPRLVLAHRQVHADRACAVSEFAVDERHVARLTVLLLDPSEDAAESYIVSLLGDGASLETIYLDLFASSARRLGEFWENDDCDFTAVTLGLWRLQRLLHSFAPQFESESVAAPVAEGQRILLAPMPGEQHTFGVHIVADFFRRAGWDVIDGPVASAAELVDLAARHWFDVIGISLSSSVRLDDLALLVRDLRRSSRNGGIGIMVGGVVFAESPDAVVRVNADVAAGDARSALWVAQELIDSAKQRLRAAPAR